MDAHRYGRCCAGVQERLSRERATSPPATRTAQGMLCKALPEVNNWTSLFLFRRREISSLTDFSGYEKVEDVNAGVSLLVDEFLKEKV
jgi:hypothetical protein